MVLTWVLSTLVHSSAGNEHRLMWGKRCVASVWENGVWHTWDSLSTGGENAQEPTVERAKRQALAALVRQNENPYKGWCRHSRKCIVAIQRECALHLARASHQTYTESLVLRTAEEWAAGHADSQQLRSVVADMQKHYKEKQ